MPKYVEREIPDNLRELVPRQLARRETYIVIPFSSKWFYFRVNFDWYAISVVKRRISLVRVRNSGDIPVRSDVWMMPNRTKWGWLSYPMLIQNIGKIQIHIFHHSLTLYPDRR
jgi:hypothetical protein